MHEQMQTRTGAVREVALGNYLPPVLARVRELDAAAAAQSPALQSAGEAVRNLFDEQFLPSANDMGLARWEKLLGILPGAADSPEQRRFRILSRINEQLPFSLRRLEQMLEALTGAGGYTITLDENTYTLGICLTLAVKRMLAETRTLLARVVPANMVTNVTLRYNTHRMLAERTHSGVQVYSHYAMKEEVLR